MGEGLYDTPIAGDIARIFGMDDPRAEDAQKAFGKMIEGLEQYRQDRRPVEMQSLEQQLMAFAPQQAMLQKMLPDIPPIDLEAMLQDPYVSSGQQATDEERKREQEGKIPKLQKDIDQLVSKTFGF